MEASTTSLSIAQAHFSCIDAFESVLEVLPRDSGSPRQGYQAIHDAFDKSKLWAGNMGAMHSGQEWKMSLYYRLRENSFYKVQVQRPVFNNHSHANLNVSRFYDYSTI
jgi:hypothetical protein